MERVLTPELMDDPGADREELRRALAYIRGVNRWFGGVSALIRLLERWSRQWPRSRPVTMLDIGTGSGDIPLAARRWAKGAGYDLRVTGVDLHATTLALAREHVAGREGIELVEADARRLMELYGPGSFDYVHAGLFLHHLSGEDVVTVLRIMERLARAGTVWNDLVRSRLSGAGLRVMMVGQPEMARHDAIVSVRAGFTRREVEGYAARAGIGYAAWHRVLWYRFTFAGEKPTAWQA